MSPRLLGGIAVACLGVGLTFLVERVQFLRTSEPVTATITEADAAHFTVRFETDGGIVMLTRPLPVDREERDRLKPGTALAMRYPNGSPADARVDGMALWFFPFGLLLVGAVGLIAARYARQRPSASDSSSIRTSKG